MPRASSRSSSSASCSSAPHASSAAAVRRVGRRGRDPQRERERDEPLLRAVVQVPLDPAPRLVRRLDDAGARRLELDPGVDVGDRLPDELGERAQPRLGVPREGRADRAGRDGAPEPAVDDDRRRDGRTHAERAQLGGVLARHALVGVDPGRRERLLDPGERRRAADGDLPAGRERADAGSAPVGEHGREPRAVVAGRHRRIGVEVARHLARDELEDLVRRVLPRHHRGHAPQRPLLLQPAAQRQLEPLVLERERDGVAQRTAAERPVAAAAQHRGDAAAVVPHDRHVRRRGVDLARPAVRADPGLGIREPVRNIEPGSPSRAARLARAVPPPSASPARNEATGSVTTRPCSQDRGRQERRRAAARRARRRAGAPP